MLSSDADCVIWHSAETNEPPPFGYFEAECEAVESKEKFMKVFRSGTIKVRSASILGFNMVPAWIDRNDNGILKEKLKILCWREYKEPEVNRSMTVENVEKHRYWVDENGNIWERESYHLEPTATFVILRASGSLPPPLGEETRMHGAVGCPNFDRLVPLEHPRFEDKT